MIGAKTHRGLNKDDLDTVNLWNSVIMSYDHTVMLRTKDKDAADEYGCECYHMDAGGHAERQQSEANDLRTWDNVCGAQTAWVRVNRIAFIRLLQMMDSDDVIIRVGDLQPMKVEGSRKTIDMQAAIAPVINPED